MALLLHEACIQVCCCLRQGKALLLCVQAHPPPYQGEEPEMQEHVRAPARVTVPPLDLQHVCLREYHIPVSVRMLLLPCMQAPLQQGVR